MPSILNEIGWFQFENLIKNRVPFLLVNLGVDLNGLFQSIYQTHLETQVLNCKPDVVLESIKEKKIPAHHAILLICHDGSISTKLIDDLEAAGFMNVFYAKSGFQGLLKERD